MRGRFIVFACAAGLVISACSGAQPAAQPSTVTVVSTETVTADPPLPTPAPATAAAEPTIPGDGTFLVGSEVEPGTYRSSEGCFWWRLSDKVFAPSAFIQTGVEPGPAFVTIEPSDVAFRTQGCGLWAKVP